MVQVAGERKSALSWWGWAAWGAVCAASGILYPHLPAVVATHFDASGKPNGYMSRLGATIVMPIIMLALIGLWNVFWRIDPKRAQYAGFWSTYRFFGGIVVVFMGCIQLWLLLHAIGVPGSSQRVPLSLIGLFVAILANYLPRVSPNWLVGIRTPWTLASEETWRRTHRTAGALGVATGLLCVVCAWVVPIHFAILGILVLIVVWAALSTILSYVYFRRG